jgi:hypothetical protein
VSKGASSLIAALRIGSAMLWHIMTFPVRPLPAPAHDAPVLAPEAEASKAARQA